MGNGKRVKGGGGWLAKHRLAYEFVDFKKTPPDAGQLEGWCKAFGWETVLNRRGTTWRLLPPAVRARVKDQKTAVGVMLDKPSAIKRPVIESGKTTLIGFDE